MIVSVIILTITCAFCQISPSILPDQFEQTFDEAFNITDQDTFYPKGKYFYYFINKRFREDRENGHYYNWCSAILNEDSPCTNYVVEGNRYLDFPEKDYCCNDENG